MKRVLILLVVLIPGLLNAQKPPKANINKALSSWRSGKYDEAKAIIDVCITDEKTKDDAKTWFYRGIIYATFDTTSNEAVRALASNSFETAMKAFEKAEELNKNSKNELFYTDDVGFPIAKSQVITMLANYYLNQGANAYQDDDYDAALANFEKTQKVSPTDTTAYFYAGYVAQSMDNYDKAIKYLNKYNELGGQSSDAYSLLINIYNGQLDNKEKALEAVRAAMTKFPDNPDFPKVEIGILIDLNKIEEARTGLKDEITKDPTNKTLHFYLGYVNSKLEKFDEAKINFNDALKLDPTYFDAQYYLAQIFYIDAEKVKREMNNLGISEADKKKKLALDKQLVDKYKIALPYWEKAEKLNPSDTDVLDKLSIIYYYLGEDAKAARVEKRLKELGIN